MVPPALTAASFRPRGVEQLHPVVFTRPGRRSARRLACRGELEEVRRAALRRCRPGRGRLAGTADIYGFNSGSLAGSPPRSQQRSKWAGAEIERSQARPRDRRVLAGVTRAWPRVPDRSASSVRSPPATSRRGGVFGLDGGLAVRRGRGGRRLALPGRGRGRCAIHPSA